MSLNLRNQSIRRIDVKVAADVTAGTPVRTSGQLGVPVDHALNGQTVAFIQEGVVSLTLTGSLQGTLNSGSYLYWNRGATPTANALSLGAAAGDIEFGQIVGADPMNSSKHLVSMRVGFPRAAAGNAQ